MEPDEQNPNFQENPVGQTSAPQAQVKYPIPAQKPKSKKTFAVILMALSLVLIGGGIFYFLGQKSSNEAEPSPTAEETFGVMTEDEATPTASASPEAVEVDKESIKIQIFNGTGIPKEASYLQGVLKELGYTKIEAANSEKQDYETTEVTFAKSLDSSVVSEITAQLEKVYKSVKTSTSSSSTVDVKIITGLRKGATPKASDTATSKASPTATPKATSTATPTPTSTSTGN